MASYVLSPAAQAMAHMRARGILQRPQPVKAPRAAAKKKKKKGHKPTKSCSKAGRKLAQCK